MRSARVLPLIAMLAILVAACTGTQTPTPSGGASAAPAAGKPQPGGTVTFALENDVSDLDPMLSGLFVDRNIMSALYDSLVRVDPKGNIIPWLAEKWDTSGDGKTVTFSLRKDVKFHDGTSLDADLVKWNIDRYRTTKESRRTADLGSVDSVVVSDPSTVKFNLKSAFAPLLAALVDRAGMIVSRKVVESAGADFTLKPFKAGSGPFVLTEAVKNDHYTLEKNKDWWGKDKDGNKLPYLDKVVVRPIVDPDVRLTNIRTGNAQVINGLSGKDVPAVKADPSLMYQQVGAFAWASLVPNSAPGFIFSDHRYITADIKTMLFSDIVTLQQQHKHAGMTLVGWSGRLDPDGNTYDFVVTGSPNNDSSYSNAKVDDLMKQQRAESDPAKRKQLLLQAQQIYVVDDPARVWYSFDISPIVTVKSFVGMEPYPDRIPRFQTGWLQK